MGIVVPLPRRDTGSRSGSLEDPSIWLRLVILMNYMVIVLCGIWCLTLLFRTTPIAFIIMLMGIFFYWMLDGLKKFDLKRMRILLVTYAILFVMTWSGLDFLFFLVGLIPYYQISFLIDLVPHSSIIFFWALPQFLILLLHKPTLKLFK